LKTIHTFGDSHGGSFPNHAWSNITIEGLLIEIHGIGPRTCAYFGFSQLAVLDISQFNVSDGDIVCFSFGEIDVRRIDDIKDDRLGFIDGVVDRYFEAIKLNVSKFSDLKVIVQCVTPTARIQDTFNPVWPTLGTDEERRLYTEHFNLRYKENCERYGYFFLDHYREYCTEDGFLNISLSDGCAHLKEPMFIKLKLMEILNKL
jgi:hypothetical protein